MSDQASGLPSMYVSGIGCIAVVSIVALLLMNWVQRMVVVRCLRMQDDLIRAEQAQGRLQALLTDLLATMNLSLARYARESADESREAVEQLRVAVMAMIEAQRHVLGDRSNTMTRPF